MFINLLVLVTLVVTIPSEIPSAEIIIARSIEFHDPNNNWETLQVHLNFVESRPKGDPRHTSAEIDNKNGIYCISREANKMQVQRHIVKDSCFYNIDEYEELTEKDIEKYKLTDDRTFFLRNYYLYLWGLPMKLRDKGTHFEQEAKLTKFDKKSSYEVKVWYDKETGSDIWFFYFDPETYALIGYRFYHDLEKGDGEYITLDESELVLGINMPKNRSWYTHQDSTYLGTDTLESFEELLHKHN